MLHQSGDPAPAPAQAQRRTADKLTAAMDLTLLRNTIPSKVTSHDIQEVHHSFQCEVKLKAAYYFLAFFFLFTVLYYLPLLKHIHTTRSSTR